MSVKHFIAMLIFPIFKMFTNPPKVASIQQTMQLILDGKSIARFGDGEFEAISQNIMPSFQSNSSELAADVLEAFHSTNSDLLIAIAEPLSFSFKNINPESREHWIVVILKNWNKWKCVFEQDKVYANAMVSRPYIGYFKKNEINLIANVFDQFKSIWFKKNLLIVEGEFSRVGVADDLFAHANSVRRVICPPKDAYNKIKDIELTVRHAVNDQDTDLVLFSLGQTASVMIPRLLDLKIQLIDIGHLDVEYNWFQQRATHKINIPGKWVNEAQPRFVEFSEDSVLSDYRKQIVNKIE